MKRRSLFCCHHLGISLLVLGWHFSLLAAAAAASNQQDSSSLPTTTPSRDNQFGRRSPQNWNRFPVLNASTPRPATIFDPSSFHLGFDPTEIDADFDPDFISRQEPTSDPPAVNSEAPDSSSTDESQSQQPQKPKLPHSPVIYRYYGKSRSRTRTSGSAPFILLGPNVDHWRATGEQLAARGFSVIACERDPIESEEGEDGADDNSENNNEEWWKGIDSEGANMVSNVLQASRWTKAILVACDSEAKLAIQAAFCLAPDKIAGLVLVGDLKEVDSLLEESHPDLCQRHGNFAVDALLHQILPCPFAIAWDGESALSATPSQYDGSSPAECLQGNRCFILGGGVAPHRRQPETFAWTLTRFVEDKVAPSITMAEKRNLFGGVGRVNKGHKGGDDDGVSPRALRLPKRLKRLISADYFSSEAVVVYGRVIASALLYASLLKVGIFQYGTFLDGMVNMKNQYDTLRNIKKRCLEVISGFLVNFGYIHFLFRSKGKTELDPVDYVTELEPFDGSEGTPNEDDNDKSGEVENSDEDSQKEETGDSQSETEDENASPEDTPKDKEPEEEETKHRFRPIFFLDRVVASAHPAPQNDTHDQWSC